MEVILKQFQKNRVKNILYMIKSNEKSKIILFFTIAFYKYFINCSKFFRYNYDEIERTP